MRITRLRLNGFKSFVDPTDMVIAEGLTGVVGPNGCGKSNLLEALRWVMGENRPTAMRGEGMEDVIFAGAATRPARHFAEVGLVIDNTDRRAPAGFNDADQLDVVRRITREAGSAFRVQGREVRARDVQILFADASTGAHSPALVRQGQIAELINARPVARRRVLEEAAGIAGLYARRHEAELKLRAAEANLARLDDIIAALAQQLQALARQVRAAARYREIGLALRLAEGQALWRRWAEADQAAAQAASALRDRLLAAARAEGAAQAAAAARVAAEAALPPLRDEAAIAGAVRQRTEAERAALAGEAQRAEAALAAIGNQMAQLQRDIAREAALTGDADATIAELAAEAARLTAADVGQAARLAQAAATAAGAANAAADRDTALGMATEEAARLAARHQAADRLAEDHGRSLTRAVTEAARATAAAADAARAAATAVTDQSTAAAALGQATRTATRAEAVLAEADAARAETQAREGDARALRSGAEGEASALRAEVQALTRLVARETGAGAQMLDLVQVAPGFEAALGAALADDLRAPVADRPGGSGWAALPPYADPPSLPAGAAPLAAQVAAPDALARRLQQVGLVDAALGPGLQGALRPGQRLVSQAGDLWRWDGFSALAADAPKAAALRLRQLNRLVEIKRDLEDAAARAMGTAQAHEHLSRRLVDLTAADATARTARRDADRLLAEAHRHAARAEADQSLAEGRREAADMAAARHLADADAARAALAAAQAARADLPDLARTRAGADLARSGAEAARAALIAARGAEADLRREGETRARRLADIARDSAGWVARAATAAARAAELAARLDSGQADLVRARARPAALATRARGLDQAAAQAQARLTAADDALAAADAAQRAATVAERDAERAASDTREARARAEALADTARAALDEAATRIADELDLTPPTLAARLGDTAQLPPLARIDTDIAALRRQREALGAVNLRAEEDAREVEAEHRMLTTEKADLDGAIRALRGGIASLNREGRERLLNAFEQVNANFALLFTHLFGGGEAKLVLVENDDPLEAGLEILCQPPGKKLSTLSLLSGGEQTLTALALIFGVFLANPAPICVLDEVDAPLDDANVTRFCDLLDEMSRRTDTRFLVITHHAVTMSRMDRLFGVTMAEQGVSQLVSVDLRRAAALVA